MARINSEKPIFMQIMEMIEDDILLGTYKEGEMIISTTQIAKLLSVNPATAVKAVSILNDKGVVCKKRGLGMQVTAEAREIILEERKTEFYNNTLPNIVNYAEKIGISKRELASIIEKGGAENGQDK